MITISPVSALQSNYIWAMTSAIAPNKAVIVDPGQAAPIVDYLKTHELTLAAILTTHHHHDHTGGIDEILSQYDCPVYAGAHEPIAQTTHALVDLECFTLPELGLSLQAIHVPGHTHGHTAYYGHDVVFTGDTLFAAGCGRNFEGSAEQLYQSLIKLAKLPMETQIYCGHEYTEQNLHFGLLVEPDNLDMQSKLALVQTMRQENECTLPSSLADEMNTNIFYRTHLPQVKQAAQAYCQKTLETASDVFAVVRAWKSTL